MEGELFVDVRYTGEDLDGIELTDVRYERCDFSGASMEGAQLERVTFTGCRMSGLVAPEVVARNVSIADCRLDEAWLRMGRWDRCEVLDSDLTGADLYGAKLTDVQLRQCRLDGIEVSTATFERVDLRGSSLLGLRGAGSLRGVRIAFDQILPLAASMLPALGIEVDDPDT